MPERGIHGADGDDKQSEQSVKLFVWFFSSILLEDEMEKGRSERKSRFWQNFGHLMC
jgi:hypothetical protein